MVYLKNYRDINGNLFMVGDDFSGDTQLKDYLLERGIISA